VLPSLAKLIGLNEALMLQQIHYWERRSANEAEGHKWVWNTYEDWQAQFPFWSLDTIQRTILALERPFKPSAKDKRPERGPLLVARKDLNTLKFDRTKWYRVDREELSRLESLLGCPSPQVAAMDTASCGNAHRNLPPSESRNLRQPITRDYRDYHQREEETENEAPPAPAKVEQCGSFQVQVFEPVVPASTAPTPPQRQPVPLEASNRRCEPDPRDEPKAAVTLGKACDDAIFLYCDKAGYLKWIDRLKVYAAKFRDERGIPEAVLIGLLPQAAERGRKLWSEHDHGQHGPRPIFLNRLEEGLADAVNLWQQEQRAEANRREAAEKARKREAAPPVDHAEEFRRHMDALVEAGPGSPEWEAITSKTERDIVRQRYRQRHPDQWVAYLERQAAQMQAQRAGAHS
jgi:hypothetical protein